MSQNVPDHVIQNVKALPPLPAVVTSLLDLTAQAEVDLRQIADVIALDPSLTVRFLRLANSAFYGFPKQIRTVQQAVILLGRYAARNVAVGVVAQTLRSRMQEHGALDPLAFWKHSIGVACCARKLARTVALDPEDAFVAGLMHDVGKIVLLDVWGDTYAGRLQEARCGTKPLHLLEREAFGYDHAAMGQALCRHWNLPEVLSGAIARHHDAAGAAMSALTSLADLVHLADVLVKLKHIGESGNPVVGWEALAGLVGDAPFAVFLEDMLGTLPAEVAEIEALFFGGVSAPGHEPSAGDAGRGVVQLCMGAADKDRFMAVALQALGYTPATEADGAPLCVVVDQPPTLEEQARYRVQGRAVLVLSDERHAITRDGWLNLQRFQAGLHQAARPSA